MPAWEEKENKISELEEEEKIYYWKESKARLIIELSEKFGEKLIDVEDCGKIWWKIV